MAIFDLDIWAYMFVIYGICLPLFGGRNVLNIKKDLKKLGTKNLLLTAAFGLSAPCGNLRLALEAQLTLAVLVSLSGSSTSHLHYPLPLSQGSSSEKWTVNSATSLSYRETRRHVRQVCASFLACVRVSYLNTGQRDEACSPTKPQKRCQQSHVCQHPGLLCSHCLCQYLLKMFNV